MRETLWFLASLAGAAILTALAVLVSPTSPLWRDILILGAYVLAVCAALLFLEMRKPIRERARVVPLVGMVISGLAFVGCVALYFFWPTDQSSLQELSAPFSWAWDSLTDDQSSKLVIALNRTNKNKIQIACLNEMCSGLASGFADAFTKAGWEVISNPTGARYAAGATGLSVNKTDDQGQIVRDGIQSVLKETVGVRALDPSLGVGAGKFLVLVIGGKQPPTPLPPKVANEVAQLAKRLDDLSGDLSSFAADRDREFSRLAPMPEQASQPVPGQINSTLYREFKRRGDFDRETSGIAAERYGARFNIAMIDLDKLSIRPSFPLDEMDLDGSGAKNFAKWLAVMGDLLGRGEIVEAREKSADVNYWFHQIR